MVDVFSPTKSSSKWGTETLRVLARVSPAAAITARDASGLDGVTCRLIMSEEEKAMSKVIWLKDADLEGALRQKDRIEGAQGLVANERGFGIRVLDSSYADSCTTLLGEAAMQVDGKIWEISENSQLN